MISIGDKMLKPKNLCNGDTFAPTWLVIIIGMFVLMLTYSVFYPFINITLFDMVAYSHGDLVTANLICTMLDIFPYMFITTILIWGIFSAIRREDDVQYR